MTTATLTRMGPSPAIATRASGCRLCILGSRGLVEFRQDPVDPAQKAALDQKVDAVWQMCIQEFNTQDVMIDFGRSSVSYTDQQGQTTVVKTIVVNLKDQVPAHLTGIQQAVDDVMTTISALYKDIKRPEPLGRYQDEEAHHASFHALAKMPVRSFLRPEHFGSAKGFGGPQTANDVMNQLLACEVFTQALENEVEGLVKALQEGEKNNPTQQGRERLHSFERFLDEVRQADRYAMYWAIGARIEAVCVMSYDFEGRAKEAGRVREGMSEALVSKLAGKGPKSADTAQIDMYAREASSLVFHNPAENVEKIRQENSQGQDIRYPRRASMAEFVVDNVTDISLDNFDVNESLKSQGYQDQYLVVALQTARRAGNARLEQVKAIHPTLSYDQRLPFIPK